MVTIKRAADLYLILALGGKLSASEWAELEEYEERIYKGEEEYCV